MSADRNLTISINVNAGQAVQAIQSIRGALSGLNQQQQQSNQSTKQQTQAVAQSTDQFKDWQQAIDRARRNAYAMTIAGYQLAASGRAITGALKETVEQASEVDFAIRRAATTLEILDETSAIFKGLTESVSETAIATKLFDAEEIARGYYFWGSTTGQVVKSQQDLMNVQKGLLPVMQAAAITETGYQTAIKGTLSILQQFRRPYSEAKKVTEDLFYITQKTANEYPDLIEAFKMVGPVANQMNVSLREVMLMFGKLGDVGIKGTTAGRALRQVFRQLSRETPIATKALNEATSAAFGMGKTFKEIVFPNGKFAGMSNFLSTLVKITENMDEAQRGHLFSIIATAAEMPTLITLVNQQAEAMKRNTTIFEDAEDKIDFRDAARVFAESWALMENSIKAVIGELKAKLQPIVLTIGRTFVEVFRPVAAVIGDAALALNKFAIAHPQLTKMAVAGIAALGALTLLGGSVLLLTGGIRLLSGAVLPQFILEMLKGAAAGNAAAGGIAAYNAAVATSGVVTKRNLASMAVYALTLGRVNLAARGAAASQAILNPGLLGTASATSLLGKRIAIFGTLMKPIHGLATGLGKIVAAGARLGAVAGIVTFVAGAFSGLFKALGGGGGDLFGSLGNSLQGVFAVLGKVAKLLVAVGMLFFKAGEAVGFMVGQLVKFVAAIPGIGLLGDAVSGVADVVGGAIDKIVADFDYLFTAIDTSIAKIQWSQMTEEQQKALTKAASAEEKAYTDMESRRVAAFTSMNEHTAALSAMGITDMMEALEGGMAEGAPALAESIDINLVNPFSQKFQEIKDAAREAGTAIPGLFASTIDPTALSAVMQPMVDSAIATLSNSNAKTKARTAAAETLFSFVDEFYHSGAENIPPAAAGVVDFAIAAIQSKDPEMRNLGYNAMVWMAQGHVDGGASAVGPAINSILSASQKLIASTNPGQRKLGYNMMANLALGMANNEPNKATKAVLMSAYRMLASGNPAMMATGYNLMVSMANGLSSGSTVVAALLNRLRNAMVSTLGPGAVGAIFGAYMAAIHQQYGMMQVKFGALPKIDFNASQFSIPSVGSGGGLFSPAPSGGSKGTKGAKGKSSSGDKESPLENALNVAEQGVRLYEALRKLEGVNLMALVKSTMAGVAKALTHAVNISYNYAKTVSAKKLKVVAEWSTVASSVAGLVGQAAESFEKLGGYKNVKLSVFKSILSDVSEAVRAAAYYGKSFKAKALVAATQFADTGATVVGAIGSAFETFSKIGAYTRVSKGVLNNIAADMVIAVKVLIDAMKGIKQTLVDNAAEFGSAASTIVGAFADAFGAFKDLNAYEKPLPDILRKIRESMVDAIGQLAMASDQFKFSDEQLTKLLNFADLTEKVMAAFNLTWQTFNQDIRKVDEWRVRPDLGVVFKDIASTVRGFDAIAALYSTDRIDKIGKMATTASGIAGAIEAFFGIGKNVSQDPDVLSRMVAEALGAISIVMADFAHSFEQTGVDIIQSFVSGVRSQEGVLSAEMERIRAITSGALVVGAVVVTGDNPNVTITHIIKDPDGALQSASSQQVADLLSGQTFLTNLSHAVNTQ